MQTKENIKFAIIGDNKSELYVQFTNNDAMDPTKFCPAQFRLSEIQTWYYPSSSSPKEKTYCQFCVERGCVDKVDLTSFESNTCNCDCPQLNSHKDHLWEVIPYTCQLCRIKGIDANHKEERSCQVCHRTIPWGTQCCEYCSSGQARCLICGEAVKPNDSLEDYPSLKLICRLGSTHVQTKDKMTNYFFKQSDGQYRIIYSEPSEDSIEKESDKVRTLSFAPPND